MELGVAAAPPISLFWALPFAFLLTAIAVAPFIHKHWWEKNYSWVSIALGALAASYYLLIIRSPAHWLEGMAEYVSFIIMLGSLFIVSGGISIRIAREATPLANSTLLLIGAILANVFGTTGASMLLIRPFLRMNREHLRPFHIVFFIFIVGNVGGALTPIGDPPLFLGYLAGIPFWWFFAQLHRIWLVTIGLLLIIFLVMDILDTRRQTRRPGHEGGPQVHVLGAQNFIFIALIVIAVFQKGFFDELHYVISHGFSFGSLVTMVLSREVIMLVATGLSYVLTSRVIYETNEFNLAPIKEVAILFIGIFATMVPAIQYLQENSDRMPVRTPGRYYYATGVLSAALDNAPTYKTFLELRLAQVNPADVETASNELKRMAKAQTLEISPDLPAGPVHSAVSSIMQDHADDLLAGTVTRDELTVAFLLSNPMLSIFVVAISAGSVLWGACTYIGNGPNFMIKSIADSSGARSPDFMRFIYAYSLPILVPVYVLVWAIFFHLWG